jgi:hypothetical protein
MGRALPAQTAKLLHRRIDSSYVLSWNGYVIYGPRAVPAPVFSIPTDPNTLPAPSGRRPAPTRGAVETCAHGERDSSEREAISEEETVAEAEARSKAGASHEAATKTCTTKSIANKPASEPAKATATEAAAAKTPATEATATKTAAVETTATKPTSITGVGSDHGTDECHGG